MKSQSLQEAVKKIFSDSETRSQFLKDPESVLARFTLTEPEKKAMLTTHAKLGLAGSDSAQLAATINSFPEWLAN